jgi:hypothetical protein
VELKEFKSFEEAKKLFTSEFLASEGYLERIKDILLLIGKEPISEIPINEIKEKAVWSIFIQRWNDFIHSINEDDAIYLSDYKTSSFLIASLVRELWEIKKEFSVNEIP